MAASRAVLVSQVFGMSGLTRRCLPATHSCLVRQFHQTSSLEKMKSNNRVIKAPPVPKEKDKFISKRQLAKVKEQQELRKSREAREYVAERPVDDVWLHVDYPPMQHDFRTAIELHKELANPEMFDNMDGLVYFSAQINMKTKKKTKFISAFHRTVLIPHTFSDGSWNRVVAFALTPEEKERALEAGASFAGGMDLLKSFEQGELKYEDDYDHVVTTTEMLPQLRPIRKLIQDCMPEKRYGSVGEEIELLVKTFAEGKRYEAIKLDDAVGRVSGAIGKLSMPVDQLEENFEVFVKSINEHKSPGIDGPFMSFPVITCPPSPEEFHLKDELVQVDTEKPKGKSTDADDLRELGKLTRLATQA